MASLGQGASRTSTGGIMLVNLVLAGFSYGLTGASKLAWLPTLFFGASTALGIKELVAKPVTTEVPVPAAVAGPRAPVQAAPMRSYAPMMKAVSIRG